MSYWNNSMGSFFTVHRVHAVPSVATKLEFSDILNDFCGASAISASTIAHHLRISAKYKSNLTTSVAL